MNNENFHADTGKYSLGCCWVILSLALILILLGGGILLCKSVFT